MAYVKWIDKPQYTDPCVMKTVIRYIVRVDKTENNYIGGYNLLPLDAELIIEQFVTVKKAWHKTEGKQIRHFVVSFGYEEHITENEAWKLAYYIATYYAERYQIIYAVHEDNSYVHIHFVFNTVSFRDGLIYAEGKEDFARLKNHIFLYLNTSLWTDKERPKHKGLYKVNGTIIF